MYSKITAHKVKWKPLFDGWVLGVRNIQGKRNQ